jgi:ketosteroid isomerase-like protein
MSPSDHETDHETRFSGFLAAVPTTVERSHIEDVVHRFMSTYASRDVETRISLFAEALCFEDPAGHRLASTKAELEQFFVGTIASGVSLRFFPERLVVVGDEALQIARLLIERGETDTTLLLLHLHFVFNPDGLIAQVRVFFDAGCASTPAQ